MSIEEIRNKKKDAESKLSEIIRGFEAETTLQVTGVNFDTVSVDLGTLLHRIELEVQV